MGKGKTITAFVLSLLFWIPVLGIIFSIVGLSMGISSLKKSKEDKSIPKGLAIAAIAVGGFGILASLNITGLFLSYIRIIVEPVA